MIQDAWLEFNFGGNMEPLKVLEKLEDTNGRSSTLTGLWFRGWIRSNVRRRPENLKC